MSVWMQYIEQCKSQWPVLCRCLFFSRQNWRQRAEKAEAVAAQREQEKEQLSQDLEQARQDLQQAKESVQKLRQELQQAKESTEVVLPDDPVLPGHQYGPRMISLCINLARCLGLRPAVRALTEIFRWLGVDVKIPTYQAIRIWMQRLGIAEIKRVKKKDGRIWIVDHSNQIGQEKIMVILGVEPDKLPARGETLDRSHVEILATIPSQSWKAEDVARVYEETAQKFGVPRAVLMDGAPELRDAVKIAKWSGKKRPIVLRDMKHFLSNRLESLLTKDADFSEFVTQQGKTRSAIQQTELGYFGPPKKKSKARFMNLKPQLNWGLMVHWHVKNPAEIQTKVSAERLEAKLGWIKNYGAALTRWSGYQEIISTTLTWINKNGLYRGAAQDLRKELQGLSRERIAKTLVTNVIDFVTAQEEQLKRGERLWLSTEILESLFGTYKQFEGQHSKSGFTRLLPTFASLLKSSTAESVKQCFSEVTVADVNKWLDDKLPVTLHGQRTEAYRRYRKATLQT